MIEKNLNILILDIQPIDPAIGGGRLRLLGLYHNLGKHLPAKYIGTYDWPGEKHRDHFLSETLREINIPLSSEHFAESQKWQKRVDGKNIIDTTFHKLAQKSSQYVDRVRNDVVTADVVIFSHPWVYPLVKDLLNSRTQIIIYDSHNVEGYLRYKLLNDGGIGAEIVREVAKTESELCHFADVVFACSQEDRELFHKIYNVSFNKMKVVPNGVFSERINPASPEEKKKIRKQLGLMEQKTAVFIGSNYAPNVEACNFITTRLAPNLPGITFIIAGGVGEGLNGEFLTQQNNIKITGHLSEQEKNLYLIASDIAINPMISGSGTNIKMFDFMAAGLPILSSDVGARGIATVTDDAIQRSTLDSFGQKLITLLQDERKLSIMSDAARLIAKEKYAWERISPQLGIFIHRYTKKKPYFSVIISSYNRHGKLNELMKSLVEQQYRDFEVIVIDQSDNPWDTKDFTSTLDLLYVYTDIKGAIKARNLAAFYAQGKVLAFTDDDCLPLKDWLSNAKKIFDKNPIIGIEGLIESDKLDNPDYRAVTNQGFQNIGFMTANLFLMAEVFNRINGFDERFDHPHFREDTDLAWRALEYGEIPFSSEVCVFHPAHLRTIQRESIAERNKFFEKDALLLHKHPQRYMDLFLKENHWAKTEGFWENFLRGVDKYDIDITHSEILKYYKGGAGKKGREKLLRATNKRVATSDLSTFIAQQLQSTNVNLSTEIPYDIETRLPAAMKITEKVKKIVGNKTHGSYFESSIERYKHYFAVADAFLQQDAHILDIGNAPGHVGIGLDLLGMKIQGINLNNHWLNTYPSTEWPIKFNVIAHDIENGALPFSSNLFDAIYFTEVLEHLAVKNPSAILPEFIRVLKPGGILVLSTPNICNLSNLYSLMNGQNIFWPADIFYGSLDRHNREYTPQEVQDVVVKAGFKAVTMYGFNCQSNWRSGGDTFALNAINQFGDNHPLLRNTILLYAFKDKAQINLL